MLPEHTASLQKGERWEDFLAVLEKRNRRLRGRRGIFVRGSRGPRAWTAWWHVLSQCEGGRQVAPACPDKLRPANRNERALIAAQPPRR